MRCADDFVIAGEWEADAQKIMAVLPKRCPRFGLRMHPTQTAVSALRKPEAHQTMDDGNGTCDLLGLTPYGMRSRWGCGVSKGRTARKRLRRTKKALWRWGRTHRHAPWPYQYQRLCLKLRGHFRSSGVRGYCRLLEEVRLHAEKACQDGLRRRRSKSALRWAKLRKQWETSVLPLPKIVHRAAWLGRAAQ